MSVDPYRSRNRKLQILTALDRKIVGALPSQRSAPEATPALPGAALENNNWASPSHSAAPWHRAGQAPAFGTLSDTRGPAEDTVAGCWIADVRGSGKPPGILLKPSTLSGKRGHHLWLIGSLVSCESFRMLVPPVPADPEKVKNSTCLLVLVLSSSHPKYELYRAGKVA